MKLGELCVVYKHTHPYPNFNLNFYQLSCLSDKVEKKRLEIFCLSLIFFLTPRNTDVFKMKSLGLTLKYITIMIPHKRQSFYGVF